MIPAACCLSLSGQSGQDARGLFGKIYREPDTKGRFLSGGGYGLGGVGGILETHFVAPAAQAGSKPLPVAVRDGYQDVISPGGQRLMTGCNGNSGPLSFFHK